MDKEIKALVNHYYWELDINCARTMLLSLGNLFKVPVDHQTLQAALGMHGAGGFRSQCGLVEGGLMFIGIYSSQNGYAVSDAAKFCYQFAEEFTKQFSSLMCYDLRPNGFHDNDPPHVCEGLTIKAIQFTYDFIKSKIN